MTWQTAKYRKGRTRTYPYVRTQAVYIQMYIPQLSVPTSTYNELIHLPVHTHKAFIPTCSMSFNRLYLAVRTPTHYTYPHAPINLLYLPLPARQHSIHTRTDPQTRCTYLYVSQLSIPIHMYFSHLYLPVYIHQPSIPACIYPPTVYTYMYISTNRLYLHVYIHQPLYLHVYVHQQSIPIGIYPPTVNTYNISTNRL